MVYSKTSKKINKKVRVSLRCGPSCDACSVRYTKPRAQKRAVQNSKPIQETYWLTSILILRSMAFVYLIAFSVAYFQNKPLIGTNGLYPYTHALEQHASNHTSYWDRFISAPTLLWLMPYSNDSLDQIALCGMLLSSFVLLFGYALCHFSVFVSLWMLYHSLANVGGLFYGQSLPGMEDDYRGGIGVESQLLETGFLAIFLCRTRLMPWKYKQKPSKLIILLFLWLSLRVMIGAGMIKIRAGGCWLDYTCMYYHYETQPNPSPMAWVLHNNPVWCHHVEVAMNHFIELIAPWLLFVPVRKVRIGCVLLQIVFQFALITSGNLSFINWVTMVAVLAGLDDAFCGHYLWFLFSHKEREHTVEKKKESEGFCFYKWLCVGVFALIGYLSVDAVHNILSPEQIMNTSFDAFRVVNSYGAFGSVGKERFEVVLSMTGDACVDEETSWTEIVFECKPGPLDRRPCVITPYHYRLDWQIWMAGFPPHNPSMHPWIYSFVAQLLRKDAHTIQLLDESNTFDNVTHIKADVFKYEFTKQWTDHNWWRRRFISAYLPPINLQNIKQFQPSNNEKT
eukprot:521617_1